MTATEEHRLMDVTPVGEATAIDFLDATGEMCRLLVGASSKPHVKGILLLEHSGDDQKGNPNFNLGMVISDLGDGPVYTHAFAISSTQKHFRQMNLVASENGAPRPSEIVTGYLEKWA